MRTCILALALVGLCSAQNYGRFVATPGSAPKCFVQGGRTIVQYSKTFHKSFHCSHDASGCSCTVEHGSHQKGECKQFDHTDATTHKFGGDCSNAGKNQCSCSNGTAVARGKACPKHGANRCSACDDGYYLSGFQCLKTPCACTNCNCYVGANNGKWNLGVSSWSRAYFPKRTGNWVEVTKTAKIATTGNCGQMLNLGANSGTVVIGKNAMLEVVG